MTTVLEVVMGPVGGVVLLVAGILLGRRRRRAGYWATVRAEYARAIANRTTVDGDVK